MSLSLKPASFVILIILLRLIARKEPLTKKYISLFMFTAFSEIFLNLGYLFSVGSFEVNYSYIALGITFIFGLVVKNKCNLRMPNKAQLIFFFIVFIGIVIRLVSPFAIYGIDHSIGADSLFNGTEMVRLVISSYTWITLIKVLMIVYSISVFSRVYEKERFICVFCKYIPVFKFYILFSVIEFLVNNFINPTLIRNIVIMLFGAQKATALLPYYRMGLYSILLSCNEPSLTAYVLFFCAIGLFWSCVQTHNRFNKYWGIIGIIMMILSLTLTGIIFATLLVVVLISKRERKKRDAISSKLIVGALAVLAIVISIIFMIDLRNYFGERILRVIQYIKYLFLNSKSDTVFSIFGASSEAVRMYSIFNSLVVFIKSPLFGAGLGTESVCSGWFSVLAQIGICGVLCWVKLTKKWLENCRCLDWRKAFILLMVVFTVQGGMTDILTSTYYFVWLIILIDILNGFSLKKINIRSTVTNTEILRSGI